MYVNKNCIRIFAFSYIQLGKRLIIFRVNTANSIKGETSAAQKSFLAMLNKSYYLNLRNKYLPKKVHAIFVLESSPASGKYFYNPDGKITEPLFRAMMKCVLDIKPETKKEGLSEFRDRRNFLIDSNYQRVNNFTNGQRNRVISGNYRILTDDLRKIIGRQKSKIILVKANVCRLLEEKLVNDGFDVINKGLIIPFPACGQQRKFCARIQELL